MPDNNLFYNIISVASLSEAWSKLNKDNKKSRGISDETIGEFGNNSEVNIAQISDLLNNEKFQFSPYKPVLIPKDNGEKRPLQIPEVRDRVVLKSIALTVEKIFESELQKSIGVSFAYQTGIGIEDAMAKIKENFQNGYHWVLEADIVKFFNNVNKEELLNKFIYPKINDEKLNKLIERASSPTIDAEELNKMSFEEQQLFDGIESGIPQGNSLSPLFSNIYLRPFDDFMINRGYKLVRYADDFIVMFKTREEAQECYKIVFDFFSRIGLEIYELNKEIEGKTKTKIIDLECETLTFLSITYDGKQFYPSLKNVERFKKRIETICYGKYPNKSVMAVLTKLSNSIDGWFSSYYYTNVERYSSEIDSYVNRHVLLGLREFDWRFTNKTKGILPKKYRTTETSFECLSKKQRQHSGIPFADEIINARRVGKEKRIL